MIPFQFGAFFAVAFAPFDRGERNARRIVQRVLFTVGFPLFEVVNVLLLTLDHVFFRPFKDTPIRHPIFIVGNPRGGTTFLHRLLSRDEANFTSILAWQLFCPSLVARAIVRFLTRVDRAIGAPTRRLITAGQERLLKDADKIHRTRLDVPEEDEVLLLHAFASDLVALLFPRRAETSYESFDEMDEVRRAKLMGFYRRCVQRHLFQDGGGRQFLSKNPLFSSKVKSLYEEFPDARVIYLVRNPAEAIASVLSMVNEIWRVQGAGATGTETLRDDRVVAWAVYCYDHVLEVLDRIPPDRYALLRYEDLVADPESAVEHLYRALRIPMTPVYRAVLKREAAEARRHRSEHNYSLEQFGLTHEQIELLVPHIYDRFGYPRRGEPNLSGARQAARTG